MGEGDFNARTGRKRGRKKEENEAEEEEKRKSIDKKKNKDEIKLVEFIREKGWSILNGNEKRNWTYTGVRRNSVIDYILVDEEMREEIYYIKIEDAIDSSSTVLSLEEGKDRRRGEGKKGKEACRGVLDEGGKKLFRENGGKRKIKCIKA